MKKFAIIALALMLIVFGAAMVYVIAATGNVFVALVATFIFGSIISWFCIEVFSKPADDTVDEIETNKSNIEYKVVKILDKYTIVGLDSSMNYPTSTIKKMHLNTNLILKMRHWRTKNNNGEGKSSRTLQ